MGVAGMLPPWVRMVQGLLPDLHGHQTKAVAAMALAMSCRESCRLSELGLAGPTAARPASVERRFQRLLANPRMDTKALAGELAGGLLSSWRGREAVLVLDETAQREPLRCMVLSVGYRRRAIPLAWACYDTRAMPASMEEIIRGLLEPVAAELPEGVEVTLLADRGLSWPSLLDLCVRLGWHYVLRLQGQTRLRGEGLPEAPVAERAPRPGTSWRGSGEVFKDAGWRRAGVVAEWPAGHKEPWLLATDLPPTAKRLRDYRKRMWIEQSFRDQKSHGFDWARSLVRQPDHAQRLMLIVALALRVLVALGAGVIRRGGRKLLERPDRRTYSLFSLGRRLLLWCFYHDRAPPRPATLS